MDKSRSSKEEKAATAVEPVIAPLLAGDVADLDVVSIQKSLSSGWARVLPPWLIVLAGLVVYANSFRVEFISDDRTSIRDNLTIRHLWPLSRVLFPPNDLLIVEGNTVQGRPVLNLSFALNYAVHGLDVRGYHAVNLAVHLIAGLLLYGVVRRTLLLPKFRERLERGPPQSSVRFSRHAAFGRERPSVLCGPPSTWLAMAVAVVWVVHPLQTESVTYIAQRAESLAGMFYLLTMYLAIRGFQSSTPRWWRAATVAACMLGMMTKEIVVTAPLLVLLYDRFFVAESWRELWRERWTFHVSLMLMGWGTLAGLMLGTGGSNLANVQALGLQLLGRTEGLWEGHEVHWTDYVRNQPWAITRYLRLSLWPHPLEFSYPKQLAPGFWTLTLPALLVGMILVAVAMGWRRRHWSGYLGLWFLLILAPTSSVFPLSAQSVAEHRMYLSLAAVLVLVVLGAYGLWEAAIRPRFSESREKVRRIIPATVLSLVLLVLGSLTLARNGEYRIIASVDYHDRAMELFRLGRHAEAISHYQKSLELNPDSAGTRNNFALALSKAGRFDEAIDQLTKALQLKPNYADAHNNLGFVLFQMGRLDEAIAHYDEVLKFNPDAAGALFNLGKALAQKGEWDGAVTQFQKSLQSDPNFAEAHQSLGTVLLQTGKVDEAVIHLRRAVDLKPDLVLAHYNLGLAFAQKGNFKEAKGQFRVAVDLNPDFAEAHTNLGLVCYGEGDAREAVGHYERAVKIRPSEVNALNNLAWVLATSSDSNLRDGRRAVELAREACRLTEHRNPSMLRTLAAAQAEAGQFSEAQQTARKAKELAEAREDSGLARAVEAEAGLYGEDKPLRDTKATREGSQPVSR